MNSILFIPYMALGIFVFGILVGFYFTVSDVDLRVLGPIDFILIGIMVLVAVFTFGYAVIFGELYLVEFILVYGLGYLIGRLAIWCYEKLFTGDFVVEETHTADFQEVQSSPAKRDDSYFQELREVLLRIEVQELQDSPMKSELTSVIKDISDQADTSENIDEVRGIADVIYLAVNKRMSQRLYEGKISTYISGLIQDINSAKYEFSQISYPNDYAEHCFTYLKTRLVMVMARIDI